MLFLWSLFYMEIKSVGHYQTHLVVCINIFLAQNTLKSTLKCFQNISYTTTFIIFFALLENPYWLPTANKSSTSFSTSLTTSSPCYPPPAPTPYFQLQHCPEKPRRPCNVLRCELSQFPPRWNVLSSLCHTMNAIHFSPNTFMGHILHPFTAISFIALPCHGEYESLENRF